MSLAVGASTTDDVGAIAAIYAEVVRTGTASFELEPPALDEIARRRCAALAAGLPHLVARRDGAIVGFAYAGPFRPRPAYGGTVEDSLYVAANARRAGVGRALLRGLVAACSAAGRTQMIAVVGDPPANGASVLLHEAEGFRRVGELAAVGHKFGRALDLLLLQRSLAPA